MNSESTGVQALSRVVAVLNVRQPVRRAVLAVRGGIREGVDGTPHHLETVVGAADGSIWRGCDHSDYIAASRTTLKPGFLGEAVYAQVVEICLDAFVDAVADAHALTFVRLRATSSIVCVAGL